MSDPMHKVLAVRIARARARYQTACAERDAARKAGHQFLGELNREVCAALAVQLEYNSLLSTLPGRVREQIENEAAALKES
jgi:hypothetical protein